MLAFASLAFFLLFSSSAVEAYNDLKGKKERTCFIREKCGSS